MSKLVKNHAPEFKTKFWHKFFKIAICQSELHVLGLDSEEVAHGGVIHLLVVSSRVAIHLHVLLPCPLIGWPLIGRLLAQYLHHHGVSLDVYGDVDGHQAVAAGPKAGDAPAPWSHRLPDLKMCRQHILV